MRDTNKSFVESVRDLIANGKLDEAIEDFRNNPFEFRDEIILQSVQLSTLKQEIIKGTKTSEEANVARNKICYNLLELLNKIDGRQELESKYHISKELMDILAFAELQSRRDNKKVTSTKYFFSSVLKNNPKSLKQILQTLSTKDAIPNFHDENLESIPRVLSNDRILSNCLNNSLNALKDKSSEESPIKTEDLFIDVAKYGLGSSVRLLREKGIGKREIDMMVNNYSVKVKSR